MEPFYINTQVEMEKWFTGVREDLGPIKTVLYISIDPVTKIKECTIYTDDGSGNGNLVLRFPMS